MTLQSYKPYARIVTIISAIIIAIASLDATQVTNLFPDYASQIQTILLLCGVLAPAITQEMRVVRAEDIVKEELDVPVDDVDVEDDDSDFIDDDEDTA